MTHVESWSELGLSCGSTLLVSLRQQVILLASSADVASSVQEAAQSLLDNCWCVLLPTAEERTRALSALLPVLSTKGNEVHCSGLQPL
jgi:E3 ubiquitin-protein ligase HERC2